MTTLSEPLVTPKYGKWRQLVLGPIWYGRHLQSAICLDAVDKTPPPNFGVGLPELQVTFAADHPADLLFLSGAVSGKFGPRRLIAIGTVMAGMSRCAFAQVNGPGKRSGWFMAAWAAWDRDRLHRRCRPDGQMVPYSSGDSPPARWRATGWGHHNHLPHLPVAGTTNGLEHTMTTFGILSPSSVLSASQAEAAAARLSPCSPSVRRCRAADRLLPGNVAPAAVLLMFAMMMAMMSGLPADGHFCRWRCSPRISALAVAVVLAYGAAAGV